MELFSNGSHDTTSDYFSERTSHHELKAFNCRDEHSITLSRAALTGCDCSMLVPELKYGALVSCIKFPTVMAGWVNVRDARTCVK